MAYLTLSWEYKRSPYFGRSDILCPLNDNEPAEKQASESIISWPPPASDWDDAQFQNYRTLRAVSLAQINPFLQTDALARIYLFCPLKCLCK